MHAAQPPQRQGPGPRRRTPSLPPRRNHDCVFTQPVAQVRGFHVLASGARALGDDAAIRALAAAGVREAVDGARPPGGCCGSGGDRREAEGGENVLRGGAGRCELQQQQPAAGERGLATLQEQGAGAEGRGARGGGGGRSSGAAEYIHLPFLSPVRLRRRSGESPVRWQQRQLLLFRKQRKQPSVLSRGCCSGCLGGLVEVGPLDRPCACALPPFHTSTALTFAYPREGCDSASLHSPFSLPLRFRVCQNSLGTSVHSDEGQRTGRHIGTLLNLSGVAGRPPAARRAVFDWTGHHLSGGGLHLRQDQGSPQAELGRPSRWLRSVRRCRRDPFPSLAERGLYD